MRKFRIWLWVLVVVLGVPAALLARLRRAPAPTEPARFGEVPAFALVDQTSRPVTLADLRGTVWIADFIFTSCTETCPMLTTRMKNLERSLRESDPRGDAGAPPRVRLVSFSVDPEVDTPARLAAFGEKWGADPANWQFLTGPTADVQRVVTEGFKLGMTRVDRGPGAIDIVHANRFVLVDKAAQIRGYYDTESPDEMKKLVGDALRFAL